MVVGDDCEPGRVYSVFGCALGCALLRLGRRRRARGSLGAALRRFGRDLHRRAVEIEALDLGVAAQIGDQRE